VIEFLVAENGNTTYIHACLLVYDEATVGNSTIWWWVRWIQKAKEAKQ